MSRKVMTVYHDGDELKLVITCDDGSPEQVGVYPIDERNDLLEDIEHCILRYEGENEYE